MKQLKEALRRPGAWFLLYLAIWFIANLITLTWFPGWDLNQDEALHASCAMGLWKCGAVRSDMLPGSYLGQYGYGMLSGWIYYGILALVFKTFGVSIFWARLVSLLSGATVLVCVYLLAREFGNPKAGLFAAVFTGFEILFLRAAHYVRTDAMVAAWAGVAVLLFVVAFRRGFWWLFLLVGFVSGISVLVRPLGIFLVPGLALVLLLSRRWRYLLWLTLGAALAGTIMIFTNYLPFAGQPVLMDIDEPNQNSPFSLALSGKFHLIPVVIERKARFLLTMLVGWHEPVSRFALLRMAVVGAIAGALFRVKEYPLAYGIPVALVAGALLTWPFMRGGYLIFLVPLLALGFFLAFDKIRWMKWGFLFLGLGTGLLAAGKSMAECNRNNPLRELRTFVLEKIPARKTVMVNWFWFWWDFRDRNMTIAMADDDFTWGDISFAELAKRYDPDYIVIVHWKDFLIWPRQMNQGDSLFLSGLPQAGRFYFREKEGWRDFDSLTIYSLK